jgi:hypothetical protein
MTSKFPSALTRSNSLGPAAGTIRKGPSAAEVAMMDAATYKQYAQRRGEWAETNQETLADYATSGQKHPERKG